LTGISAAAKNPPPLDEEALAALTFELARNYFATFQHPETSVLYGTRLSTKDSWTSPADVLAEKPIPWGYGSRIADTVLHTGHMLVALLDAHAARPDPWFRDQIVKLFSAIQFIGNLPETHPKAGKPDLVGIVPRGPHPDDPAAWYDDSSMDQHTTYIISLALYAKSGLASAEDKEWIALSLGKVGRRLERHGWSIKRGDGVTEAHVGFAWTGFNSNHASILLPAVLALYEGTEDEHWRDVYENFLREREGLRWEQMHPGPHVRINGHPIYANQNAFRVNALLQFERNGERRAVIRGLLAQSARMQLARDFPGEMYRRFQSAETWERVRREFEWKDADLHGAAEAWASFDPAQLEGKDASMAALAHIRFPLGGFHMALLSEDEALIREKIPAIWKMLNVVDLERIAAAETHYLFTVVALHLDAQFHRHPELFAPATASTSSSSSTSTSTSRDASTNLLEPRGLAGTGPVIDVAIEGERAYAIGRGKLRVLDITEPSHPNILGALEGLGAV
ncbi:MAG: hypothetical protein ACC661_12900, partial [Verrucomicrobiales bacterium]